MPEPPTLRVVAVQCEVSGEVPTRDVLVEAGERVRAAMADAAAAGARLVVFPEGTLTYPHKRRISRDAPELGEADWTMAAWTELRRQLELVAATAADLGVWTVVGAPHWLRDGLRPHNSLYVISDAGALVTRYDKRRLSTTEITYLYTPGSSAVAFEVDGFRVGMVLCLEALFPDLFTDYADDGADLVLLPSAGGGIFGSLAAAYAAINGLAITLAIPPAAEDPSTTGTCGPFGWIDRLADGAPGISVADVPHRNPAPSFHHLARHGLYDARLAPGEPRSVDRTTF